MDINSAIRFSVKRVSLELFTLGSVFSIYSLASSLTLAFCALAWRQRKRRGHVNLRAILRAVLAKKVLNHESFHADVKLLVLSVVFMPAVIGGLVISASAVSASVSHMLAGLFGSRAPVEGGDLTLKIVSTIILFLAYEIGYWVDHYLKHRVPFLWELHKLHHTADVLTPLTNFRNHPIDNIVFGYMLAIFIGGASGLLGWLYGRNPETFSIDGKNILFLCFLWTIGHLQHSEFWIPFRGVWGRIILSPAHHQIHHSADPQHFNRNLGSVLAIWDWMFGTLEIPTEKNPRLSYGVQEEGVQQHSTFGILVRPALKSASELARALAGIGKFLSETLKSAMAPERKRRDA
jgi:sterol desaturase/sphingolipid hydroxylase (fatty acid hydroxylase superfamily)